ncbi:MAG: NAD(P)H-binding protein [Phycisphaerales bacterium]|nr:NAD(P)H-binding protein [Phycisphaerales bacterium]
MNPADQQGRTLAITGASGFVGRHVCRLAVERGWKVRALVRDLDGALPHLPRSGVQMLVGDIGDRGAVRALVEGAEAAVHLVGIRREMKPGGFRRLHVDATRRVVEACLDSGVRRYVHMSALGTRPFGASAYHKTKWEAERIVRRSALDWTIFRPSLIHGPDGEFMKMAKGWVTQKAPPFLFLPYFVRVIPGIPCPKWETPRLSPVSVDDVASAFVGALDNASTIGEVYPLVGPEAMTWPDMLRTVRDGVPGANVSLQPLGIPQDAAWLKAKTAELLGVGSLLPFGTSEAIMAAEDNVASPAKAEADLGLHPRAFEPALRAYAPLI